jgi:putative transposase
MPRQRRIVVPGEIHHVMARGLDGIEIFHKREDYCFFIQNLSKLLQESSCRCYAWVLMANHYHLVVRPLKGELSRFMLRLNMRYARYFNRQYKRRGYLFQDRFKSIATQEYWYFRELIRYVHLNPLRAGIVSSLSKLVQYPWSGHRAIMGVETNLWQSVDEVLSRFGIQRESAIDAYLQFLREWTGIENDQPLYHAIIRPGISEEASANADDRILGEASFVLSAKKRAEIEIGEYTQRIKNRPNLDAIAETVSKEFKMNVEEIFIRDKMNCHSKLRSRFCTLARKHYGYSLSQIGAYLNITAGSVSRAIGRNESKSK